MEMYPLIINLSTPNVKHFFILYTLFISYAEMLHSTQKVQLLLSGLAGSNMAPWDQQCLTWTQADDIMAPWNTPPI